MIARASGSRYLQTVIMQDRCRSGCGPRRPPESLRRRAQVTARWATMSGLETWTTLGAERGEVAPDARAEAQRHAIFGSPGDRRPTGTLTRSPVGSNAGLSTVGE